MVKGSKIGFGGKGSLQGRKGGSKQGENDSDFRASDYVLLSNIGVQGSVLFSSQEDYDRFEAYLYLLNAIDGPRASNFFLDGRGADIFTAARGGTLVAIGAYSFTPRGFLILVKEISPKGIAKFMQKLQTAYTMYFNGKYQRDGRIFHSGYRTDVAESMNHLKFLLAAVHLHPAVLFDTHWEDAQDTELRLLAYRALEYRYSSFGEYAKKKFIILSPEHFPKFFVSMRDPMAIIAQWKKGQQSSK